MGALCSRILVDMLESRSSSLRPSPPWFAPIAGCCSRVVALLLVFRRAVRLVLDNGADSCESWTHFLQSTGRGCGW